jgi:hypothetical protein
LGLDLTIACGDLSFFIAAANGMDTGSCWPAFTPGKPVLARKVSVNGT